MTSSQYDTFFGRKEGKNKQCLQCQASNNEAIYVMRANVTKEASVFAFITFSSHSIRVLKNTYTHAPCA